MKLALLYAGLLLMSSRNPKQNVTDEERIVLAKAADDLMSEAERSMNMTTEAVSFQAKKALRDNNAAGLSPIDLLEHLLGEMRAGRIDANRMAVLWFDEKGDKIGRGAAFASLDRMQALSLIEISRADCVDSWRQAIKP